MPTRPRISQRISQRISRRAQARNGGRSLIPDDLENDLLILSVLGLIGSLLLSAFARHWIPKYHPALIEAATICLTWITTVGASRAAARGLHVRVVFLADLMPAKARRRMEFFADAVMLAVAVALLAISFMLLRYSVVHPAPRGHPMVYAAVPVGMGLAVYRLWQRLAKGWKEMERP